MHHLLAIAHASLTLEASQIDDTYISVLFAVSVVTAEQRGNMPALLKLCEEIDVLRDVFFPLQEEKVYFMVTYR